MDLGPLSCDVRVVDDGFSRLPDEVHGARAAGSLLAGDLEGAETELTRVRTRYLVRFLCRLRGGDTRSFAPPGVACCGPTRLASAARSSLRLTSASGSVSAVRPRRGSFANRGAPSGAQSASRGVITSPRLAETGSSVQVFPLSPEICPQTLESLVAFKARFRGLDGA